MIVVSSNYYEIYPEPHPDPLGAAKTQLESAYQLGLDIKIDTIHFEEFRFGGNVTKAKCHGYEVVVSKRESGDV